MGLDSNNPTWIIKLDVTQVLVQIFTDLRCRQTSLWRLCRATSVILPPDRKGGDCMCVLTHVSGFWLPLKQLLKLIPRSLNVQSDKS